MAIFFGILLFSFLIFIHELGHFVAAKLSGVQVNEFAMFMGPAIFKWKKGETQYSIRCIPVGGYCAMEGEDEDSDNPRAFGRAKWWKRLIILVAGAAMNFLAGFIIFCILCLPAEQVVVPAVREFDDCCIFNTEEGLQVGDEILELDGEKVYINNDIALILGMNPAVKHDVVILRDGKKIEFNDLEMAHTCINEKGEEYLHYGFGFGVEKKANFLDNLGFAWNLSIDNVRIVRMTLQMLIRGQVGISDLTGPVGIVQSMSDTAANSKDGTEAFLNVLNFGGFIAINLAVMNMLPLPALDGGRVVALLVTTVVEKVTKKKINPKYEGIIHAIGLILLLVLSAVIFLKDIIMIFKR